MVIITIKDKKMYEHPRAQGICINLIDEPRYNCPDIRNNAFCPQIQASKLPETGSQLMLFKPSHAMNP
jgi:hypothetical protein